MSLVKTYLISISFLCLLLNKSFTQNVIISGYIIDSKTGEYLIGANIYDTLYKFSSVSNKFGFYSLSVPHGEKICLQASFVGYIPKKNSLVSTKDSSINFLLTAGTYLDEVSVSAVKKVKLEKRTEMSLVEIPMEQIKILPNISGEADVLKAYQLMPGIQMGSEGNNGIFVRGGSPDQNLFLLDDVPLYNVSHLGGIYSVFDPSMVKSIEVYKGGFPARYGGRVSSVVDVRNKDGNLFKTSGELGLSLFLTKIFIEGPIIKNKASYAASIRRCNLDLYSYLGGKITGSSGFNGYTFYDINLKSNYIISNRDRIFINYYQGRDKVYNREKEAFDVMSEEINYISKHNTIWGNQSASMRWYHVFGANIFSNAIFAYSKFRYTNYSFFEKESSSENSSSLADEYKFQSQIENLILKTNLEIPLGKNIIRTGIGYTKHFFIPGSVSYSQYAKSEDFDSIIDAPDNRAHLVADDLAAYLELTWYFRSRLSGNFGVHSNTYWVENKHYNSIEPRAMINYLVIKNLALKASYCEMQQNLHLLTNSNAGLPSDLWIPSSASIEPERSAQVAAGLAVSSKNDYELSIEAYAKKLSNLIDYKEGTTIFSGSKNWNEKVEKDGMGRVKGIEFLVKKNEGKIIGWIAYTLSKNERNFENLNNGKWYPFTYDQRHELAIVCSYKINKKLILSGTWVYHTGTAITLPTEQYQVINTNYSDSYSGDRTIYSDIHIYSSKNGFRIPDYHRLDIGLNYTKQKRKGTSVWTFGIYNAYNRQNAYYLYFKKTEGRTKLYQQSLFPILINFGYSYKF